MLWNSVSNSIKTNKSLAIFRCPIKEETRLAYPVTMLHIVFEMLSYMLNYTDGWMSSPYQG